MLKMTSVVHFDMIEEGSEEETNEEDTNDDLQTPSNRRRSAIVFTPFEMAEAFRILATWPPEESASSATSKVSMTKQITFFFFGSCHTLP
jgi:hypothetical protein